MDWWLFGESAVSRFPSFPTSKLAPPTGDHRESPRSMSRCVDTELARGFFLSETFHPNEFHLNSGLPAVNQKMSPRPALVPLFTV